MLAAVRVVRSLLVSVLLLLTIAYTATVQAINLNSARVKHDFYAQYELQLHNESGHLQPILDLINSPDLRLDDLPRATEAQTCLRCRVFAHTVITFWDRHSPQQQQQLLQTVLDFLCRHLTTLSAVECTGYSDKYLRAFQYMLTHLNGRHPDHGDGVCAIWFQSYECGSAGYNIPMNLSTGPIGDPPTPDARPPTRHSATANITILHVTDFHYDPWYAPGSPSQCNEQICCRNSSTPRLNAAAAAASTTAGYWGDYAVCDTPGYLIEEACAHIAQQHPHIEYVYYTGDHTDHFQWLSTKQAVLDAIAFVTDTLRRSFPRAQIRLLLGNHDAAPHNSFAPPTISDGDLQMDWLYEAIATQWGGWLRDSPEALDSLRTRGYCSALLRPGLRVVQLNSNVCFVKNVWLFFETQSLQQQLHWLHQTLAGAEKAGESVHILGHVPINDASCLRAWNQEYLRIIKRYAHIITGQFHGHTHQDEFAVQYAGMPGQSEAINVAWTGGSLTPFVGLNPNYRLYHVDGGNYSILDHETWTFDLGAANAASDTQKPSWSKEYSFLEEYNLSSLSPSSVGELAMRQGIVNETILHQIWRNAVKHSNVMLEAGCNDACKYEVLCKIYMCPA